MVVALLILIFLAVMFPGAFRVLFSVIFSIGALAYFMASSSSNDASKDSDPSAIQAQAEPVCRNYEPGHIFSLSDAPACNEGVSPSSNGAVKNKEILDEEDIEPMHSTYKKNQARFFRDYKGKTFIGTMKLDSVSESIMEKGTYIISFGSGFMSDIDCRVKDKQTIDFLTDMDKGDRLKVSGVVEDHAIGSIALLNCAISKP